MAKGTSQSQTASSYLCFTLALAAAEMRFVVRVRVRVGGRVRVRHLVRVGG